jgi:transcriptional regulator with XRE-family HTH domain
MPRIPKNIPKPLPRPLGVGSRIAALRKAQGLTQNELGEKLGLSQKQITDYETGKVHLSDEMIVRFSLTLKTSSDDLLGLSDMEPQQNSSLRFTRRIRELNRLPEQKKKVILRVLDDLIRANN